MTSITEGECPSCHASMLGTEIPEDSLCYYNKGPSGEILEPDEYAKIRDKVTNETTHFKRHIGVEYAGGYDGISEWQCPDCGYREGRWTGNTLTGDEVEPRFGR